MKTIKFISSLASMFIFIISLNAQTVKDADGNIYPVVKIGNQVWMAENLKTTRFNDGKAIPLVTSDKTWGEMEKPAYCWLNNKIENKDVYGALYNWYAVDTKKLCPVGWHVPSKSEWTDLLLFLRDENTAGAKLKESGSEHWKSNIIISTNEYGFTALPGGLRMMEGNFPEFAGLHAVWWSSTEFSKIAAFNRGLYFSSSKLFGGNDNKKSGFSIRCLRD